MSERTEYAVGEFCWVDLMAHDMKEAQAWYCKLFGWDASQQETDGPAYAIFTYKGKAVAGLGEANAEMKQNGVPPMWNSYVNVADCAATEAKAKALGGSVMFPTMQVMDAGTMCFIQDPSGAALALWQAGNHIGAGICSEANAFAWNELATRDLAGSKKFYSELFGWQLETADMGEMKYTMIKNADRSNGGMIQMDAQWEGVPPHWMTYFWVDDVDAKAKQVEQTGGKVCVPPTDIPVGRFSVVNDPQGATFTLFKGNQAPG
ncbi:MAG: VOC family protein [Myxococcales bacterium]|nr:VOC family protein [Myxococcales bacterium]